MKKYLLDTSVYIQAYNFYYDEKIVPTFWEFLKADKEIYTIQAVIDEILPTRDNLRELIKGVSLHSGNNFDDSAGIANYIHNHQHYIRAEKKRFLGKADYPLVCIAKADDFIVVTQEAWASENSTKVKIPNICKRFNVECINTFQLLREKQINLSHYTIPNE